MFSLYCKNKYNRVTIYIYLLNSSSYSYSGDGVSGLYIWGAKIYAGSNTTSYLPTGWETTSTTPNSCGVGTLSFTVGLDSTIPGKSIPAGATINAYSAGYPADYFMSGTVISHVGTTLLLNITSANAPNAASLSDWVIQAGISTTRAADICSVDLTKLIDASGNPLWTGTEGTIVVGFITPASFLGDTKTIVQIDSGSDLNRVCGYFGVAGYVHASVTVNGAQSFDVYKTPAIQPSSSVIFAMSFSAIGASLAVNGSSVATGIPSAFPSGLKNLQIGHRANGSEYSGATYRYVKIYNRRIADAYLPILSKI